MWRQWHTNEPEPTKLDASIALDVPTTTASSGDPITALQQNVLKMKPGIL